MISRASCITKIKAIFFIRLRSKLEIDSLKSFTRPEDQRSCEVKQNIITTQTRQLRHEYIHKAQVAIKSCLMDKL